MELNTYLAGAIKTEGVVVKLAKKLFLPAAYLLRDLEHPTPYIGIGNADFALQPCGTLTDLESSFLHMDKKPVEQFQKTLNKLNFKEQQEQEHYTSKTEMLSTVIKIFDRLEPEIAIHTKYLKLPAYQLYIPELEELREKIDAKHTFQQLQTPEVPTLDQLVEKVVPENCLWMGGCMYTLAEKGTTENVFIKTAEQKLKPRFLRTTSDFIQRYTQLAKESTLGKSIVDDMDRIKQDALEKRLEVLNRLDTLSKVGLHINYEESDFENKSKYTCKIGMTLPEFVKKIPGFSGRYFYFGQATLSSTLTFSDTLSYFECTPLYHTHTGISSFDAMKHLVHPLVYTSEQSNRRWQIGTVCLREAAELVAQGRGLPLTEQVARLYLINRDVLFHGTNMTDDPFDNPTGAHHYIGQDIYLNQHINADQVRRKNLLIMEEK